MKGKLKQLVLVFALILGVVMGTSTLANAQTAGNKSTSVGITFIGNGSQVSTGSNPDTVDPATPTVKDGSDGDAINDAIPDGTKVTKTATPKNGGSADTAAPVSTVATAPQKGGSGASAVKSAVAALAAGRLPQTGEVQSILADLVGILLLMVLILGLIVYHQARLLRERE
ncbi:RodZ family helix-turn-helix domain-containing protein [Levilactobacillus enshiensis]|uniref:hypothetical protein n=1 Tax=Levilactobacillus enshiensis TaxID=2590213 RepID=UPI00117B837B|nr:hypothetical protein [Levilactobacillus enshiensis]